MITKLDIISTKYKYMYKSLLYMNKNNSRVNNYKREGFDILRSKIDRLPNDIAFMPSIMSKRSTCVKVFDKFYIFLSMANLKKSLEERFDSLFHEIGHWLHFQQMPPKEERKKIWQDADKEKIKKCVSERAIEDDDGKEFVAEVFKGLVKGEKYDGEITYLYHLLNGPEVK